MRHRNVLNTADYRSVDRNVPDMQIDFILKMIGIFGIWARLCMAIFDYAALALQKNDEK